MDFIQDFVVANVPAPVLAHMTQHSSTYWRVLQELLALQKTVVAWLAPVAAKLRESPDLVSILLLLGILLVSLKILGMLWRTVISWIRFVVVTIKWLGLAALGVWVWQRGVDGSIEDATYLAQSLAGIWNNEYKYWQEQERVARAWNQRNGGSGASWANKGRTRR